MTGRGRTTRLGHGCFNPRNRLFGGERDLVGPVRSRVCGTIGRLTRRGDCSIMMSETSTADVVFTSPHVSVDGRILTGLKCSGWFRAFTDSGPGWSFGWVVGLYWEGLRFWLY